MLQNAFTLRTAKDEIARIIRPAHRPYLKSSLDVQILRAKSVENLIVYEGAVRLRGDSYDGRGAAIFRNPAGEERLKLRPGKYALPSQLAVRVSVHDLYAGPSEHQKHPPKDLKIRLNVLG